MSDPATIYSLEQLKQAVQKGKRYKYLFFWSHRPQPDGRIGPSCFSQWWPSVFTVEGVHYPFAEHWMMAEKARLFNDRETCNRIIDAGSPAQAKKFGREVKGFNQQTWDAHCFDIVVRANFHKFNQDPGLKEFLVNTGKRVIVEASPRDRIWGIGLEARHPDAENPLKWRGANMLGFALMKVRSLLE
ncbi:MAG: NADAR family protein [bacterium]|nr:NADAR family protein [bacterium]